MSLRYLSLTNLRELLKGFEESLEFRIDLDENMSQEELNNLGEDVKATRWSFNVETGHIDRADRKLHRTGLFKHSGGYNANVVYEEPGVPMPEDGSTRVVGHVRCITDGRGNVLVRRSAGLEGPVLELLPSSISKGELAEMGDVKCGIHRANVQRIVGAIAAYLREEDDLEAAIPLDKNGTKQAGVEVMAIDRFLEESDDDRSFGTLVKCGLLGAR